MDITHEELNATCSELPLKIQ